MNPDGTHTTGLSLLAMNDTIQIVNSDLNQPVSTSELTVSETTIGLWRYRCQAEVEGFNINDMQDVYNINVTGN